MNVYRYRFFAILALTAATLACNLIGEIAAGSGTWYVATSGSDSSDCLSEASPCRTIQAAIDKASATGNIRIADGLYLERVRVNKDGLRILGESQTGTVIDAGGTGAALTIAFEGDPAGESLEVLISQLSVQNGSADRGAGVYIAGHVSATLVLMEIRNNTARLGAGLANDGLAQINSVRILSNHATSRCGGVDNTGTMNIYRGEVSDNISDGFGGGLCNAAEGTLSIRHVDILDNRSAISSNIGAAGIYNAGRLGVYVSRLDGNRARGNGGGIYDAGLMTIGSVTLSNNMTAQEGAAIFTCSGVVRNSTIHNNSGNSAVYAHFFLISETGPGACLHTEVFLLSNSTISGNDFIGLSVNGNVRLESSTVTRNVYGLFLNGLLIDTPQEDWYVKNMLFVHNTDEDCYVGPPLMPSAGHNMDSDGTCPFNHPSDLSDRDPALQDLADNGGETWTHELLAPYPANPAVDGGGTDCPATDQRGVARPQDLDGDGTAECDIGAFEVDEFGRLSVPLEQATPTAAVTPEPVDLVFTKNAFCRKGPSANYDDLATATQGQSASVEGRNEDGSWFLVLHPDGVTKCWVSITTVEVTGPTDGLPVPPAPPLPEEPASFVIADRVCTPNGFTLRLAWSGPGSDISGYRLYRNGELIDSPGDNRNSYDDTPPADEFLTYELASYNENGSSDRLVLEDSGCP